MQDQQSKMKQSIDCFLKPPNCSRHQNNPLFYLCVDPKCKKEIQLEPLCSLCQNEDYHNQKDHEIKSLNLFISELIYKIAEKNDINQQIQKDDIEIQFEKLAQDFNELSKQCQLITEKVQNSLYCYQKFKGNDNVYKEEIRKILQMHEHFESEIQIKQMLQELGNYSYLDQRSLKINGQQKEKFLRIMKEKTKQYINEIEEKFNTMNKEMIDLIQQEILIPPTLKQPKNERPELIHYIICLDDSSSMQQEPWAYLLDSISQLLSQLKFLQKDKVTLIQYDSTSKILCEREQINAELIKKAKFRGGKTNFSALFKDINKIVNKYQQQDKFVIIFMSDGKGEYPEKEISQLSQELNQNLFKFWTIAFGALGEDTFKILSKINAELRGRFKNPVSYKQLKNCYCDLGKTISSWENI